MYLLSTGIHSNTVIVTLSTIIVISIKTFFNMINVQESLGRDRLHLPGLQNKHRRRQNPKLPRGSKYFRAYGGANDDCDDYIYGYGDDHKDDNQDDDDHKDQNDDDR